MPPTASVMSSVRVCPTVCSRSSITDSLKPGADTSHAINPDGQFGNVVGPAGRRGGGTVQTRGTLRSDNLRARQPLAAAVSHRSARAPTAVHLSGAPDWAKKEKETSKVAIGCGILHKPARGESLCIASRLEKSLMPAGSPLHDLYVARCR